MPYRIPAYPDKEPPLPGPSFVETLSKRWKSFYESTAHIRSEKWVLMFFAFCLVYMLLASFVYGEASRRYFMAGQWGMGIAYACTVIMCMTSTGMILVFTAQVVKKKF